MSDPQVLGSRYEVLRTVSEGHRASVLQALDHVHDRLVALKVFPVNDDDRDELLAEARLLMSIAPHPALPVVRGDFFTDNRDHYVVVMKWIDGIDLQQVLEEQGDPALPLSEVIHDLAIVADALDHLHAHEPPIVHGDVKPANLVRTANGGVVLVDFDIAGAHAGKGRVGTVGYVAPEVGAGEKPGPAADVYGLAATAITLLNGQPPADATPRYPGLDPAQQRRVARVLRAGLASDPARRPHSAGRLVENLRTHGGGEQPSGVVALLATEVAGASRLWTHDPDEMRVAMSRLRDVMDDVVERGGGSVVTSMNEGDRTIAVFRAAPVVALAGLELYDRVEREAFPPGIDVRLRAAVAVGEAVLVDGVYLGAVVDYVVRLRSTAAVGSIITSEATAEHLLGLVGSGVSIVALGDVVTPDMPEGASVFGITRSGAEHTAAIESQTVEETAESAPAPQSVSRPAVVAEAALHPSTLVAVTFAGLAAIFLLVLAPEVEMTSLGLAALLVGVVAAVLCFGWRYSLAYAQWRQRIDDDQRERNIEAQRRRAARERGESRRRLKLGFARVAPQHGRDGERVLEGLGEEFDALTELLRRSRERPSVSVSALLPDLTDETYRHGMSALSDALELFEFADGAQRRRLEDELGEIEKRLARDADTDERVRQQDEQRRASHQQLLARHDAARQRARDLLFEAERCTAALAEARIELASIRAGDTQVDIDAVVQTLQVTIRRVRDVQDELRKLGYA